MDPKLLALPHVAGDLDRVNLDPDKAAALRLRFGGDSS
jgi:hypothetical protein